GTSEPPNGDPLPDSAVKLPRLARTGTPRASVTFTTSGLESSVPTTPACALPEAISSFAGIPSPALDPRHDQVASPLATTSREAAARKDIAATPRRFAKSTDDFGGTAPENRDR